MIKETKLNLLVYELNKSEYVLNITGQFIQNIHPIWSVEIERIQFDQPHLYTEISAYCKITGCKMYYTQNDYYEKYNGPVLISVILICLNVMKEFKQCFVMVIRLTSLDLETLC